MDIINQIPDWLGAAICGAIGWFGHILYERYRYSRKPFEQDIKRFNSIIQAIDPFAIEAFLHTDIRYFNASDSDRLLDANAKIQLIDKFDPICLDKALHRKEKKLLKALDEITSFIAWKSFYRRGSTSTRTFLTDAFDENNKVHKEEVTQIQNRMNKLGKDLLESYRAYKSYGDRKFARKLN